MRTPGTATTKPVTTPPSTCRRRSKTDRVARRFLTPPPHVCAAFLSHAAPWPSTPPPLHSPPLISSLSCRHDPLHQALSADEDPTRSRCGLLVRRCVVVVWGSFRAKPVVAQCRPEASLCAASSIVSASPTPAASGHRLGRPTPP
jgi:hypothetical protein